ncbi:hypothetical protein FHR32_001330 [Streptosporangium album]|uniref:Uncharacterized protein n=1 Tax=Streptosporangium album TaxID=47479 RepID=A0A7W7RRT6_9ACTN|nr:hypothetical protein [Streptosporangium album]MBB4937025.1 hypothetical protein [Streptosporangium album]
MIRRVRPPWRVRRRSRGRRPEDFPARLRAEVLERNPRLGLGEELIACFRDQAGRKPDSLAATFVRNGLAGRIEANALDR